MNGKERVLAVIKGEFPDRPSFAGVLSLYGAKLTNCPIDRYYSNPDAYLEGQKRVVELVNPDIIVSPFILAQEGEAFGSKTIYLPKQPPNLKIPAIASLDQISKLTIPKIENSPRLVYTRMVVEKLKDTFGADYMIAAPILNPVDIPIMITSMENWLPAVIDEDSRVENLLALTIPFFMKWASALTKAGADFFIFPSVFTLPSIVTREIVKRYAIPVLTKVFSELKIPVVLHHVGALYLDFLDILKDLPNLAGFVIDHRDSLEKARGLIKPEQLLFGGIDGPNLDKYSPDGVKRKTLKVLKEQRHDPHSIFTMTGPDVNYDTPVENLLILQKTVKNFTNGYR